MEIKSNQMMETLPLCGLDQVGLEGPSSWSHRCHTQVAGD